MKIPSIPFATFALVSFVTTSLFGSVSVAVASPVNELVDRDTTSTQNKSPGCQSLLGCNRAAEVVLCNDKPYTINPSKQYLRTYMDDIVRQCQRNIGGLNTVCGQNFDTDGYNVIMRQCV
ncbi:hypothetical protein GLAREA_11846 [Glarea lozoyensis ATCC 20868]|uniref:Uncharacterized protein n=1 Tax=Glarea lozoyensis (strain ATCC 20868 / MF5171) TaxID=1116229 RepID=S3D3R5_GLAL2|nr:uncharacterized protein GLAREA_11846 [Glarea lozoyensis ATCC 20868]EPE31764.1 hypothetical protein GLAREA_11846 [Glarea lozoyensis ATCC 20868]